MNNKYDIFFNFLGSWFPEMDLDGLTEVEVVQNFKATINDKELFELIEQGKKIENDIKNQWVTIKNETNLCFKDEKDTKVWIDNIIGLLES